MNLTRLDEAGVGPVYEAASALAGRAGEPELVGLCPVRAAGPGCAGGLLEASGVRLPPAPEPRWRREPRR